VSDTTLDTILEAVTELSDRVEALRRQQEAMVGVVNQYSEHMTWFKAETDKLVKAAGPMLAMAGPMLAQLAAGQVPTLPAN
jgi:uncharacterized protein HemX